MDNTRGSILMVAAMAGFAIEDMFIKAASRALPVGLILILFGLGGMIGFILLTLRRGEPLVHPALLTRPLVLKAVFEVLGRLGYTLALALTPLSSASAILQATPLVVVAGAALVFGEQVGWRRWLAALGLVAALNHVGLAVWHTGVEMHLWAGPQHCSGAISGLARMAPDDLLAALPPRVVRCDEAAWSLFGISMAGWTAICSAALAGLWAASLRGRGRVRAGG
jgi:drug/metabolite transporter (DMT)-like permease